MRVESQQPKNERQVYPKQPQWRPSSLECGLMTPSLPCSNPEPPYKQPFAHRPNIEAINITLVSDTATVIARAGVWDHNNVDNSRGTQ